jgi:hypothetical protein
MSAGEEPTTPTREEVLRWNDGTVALGVKRWLEPEEQNAPLPYYSRYLRFPTTEEIEERKVENVLPAYREDCVKWLSVVLRERYVPNRLADKLIPLKNVPEIAGGPSDGFIVRYETREYHIQVVDSRSDLVICILDKSVAEPPEDGTDRAKALDKIIREVLIEGAWDKYIAPREGKETLREKALRLGEDMDEDAVAIQLYLDYVLPRLWRPFFSQFQIRTDGRTFLLRLQKEFFWCDSVWVLPNSRFEADAMLCLERYKKPCRPGIDDFPDKTEPKKNDKPSAPK